MSVRVKFKNKSMTAWLILTKKGKPAFRNALQASYLNKRQAINNKDYADALYPADRPHEVRRINIILSEAST